MKILRATSLGMCFGVRHALDVARDLADPSAVTIHGELVHNEEVLEGLKRRGFRMTPEGPEREMPGTRDVLVTAHGISEKERLRLLAADRRVIDTTCPLVRVVHEAARELERRGWFVVVVGKPGHVEVQGLTGDLAACAVVQVPDDVRTWDAPRIGVVCQTTMPPDHVARMRDAIEARNPGTPVRFVDTVCRPTRDRQQAVLALLRRVDALVVVGGRRSNNTRQLVRLATKHGVPAFHVTGAAELRPAWFRDFRTVGLTAGTSTPDATVDAVHAALERIDAIVPR